MPGMSFACDVRRALAQEKSAILHSLDLLIHTDQYQREVLLNEESYLLACTRYKEYPIASLQSDDLLIYLEGQIYGKDSPSTNKELADLAEQLSQTQTGARERIIEWLLNTDGDFVAFFLHKKRNEISIMNDALGRLPLYYHNANGRLLISRELRFVASTMNDRRFDRMTIAQYLLLGTPLGKRTLLENVHRLEPATLIRIDLNKSEIKIDNLYRHNFESRRYRGRTVQQNGHELASLFSQACANRGSETDKNIVALSGGLDSRSVAAGLHKYEIPFSGVTLLDYNRIYASDAPIAEQLANVFGIDWSLFHLSAPKGKDLLKLLRIQNGLNCLAMSYILPFFDTIKETFGSGIRWFTGDGGDQVLQSDWRPPGDPKNVDSLVEYILSYRQRVYFSLDTVASLTGIREHEILDELKNVILFYPEKEWNQKHVHFIVCEGLNFYLPGEDRNRFYFWSVTPFYSIQFFDYVMNCPEEQKSQYALYRRFLSDLSPQASAINCGGPGRVPLPIASIRFRIMRSMIGILSRFPSLKTQVARVLTSGATSSYEYDSNTIKCLQEQMINCKLISNYLSHSAMEDVIANCNRHGRLKIDTLFTLTSYIEELECGKSTIEKYCESEFA